MFCGRMYFGNLSELAVLRAVPALSTSTTRPGSSPAFTPITTASDVMAMAVADRRLFSSFIVCPIPGLVPQKKIFPRFSRIGRKRGRVSSGQDTMTASVPFSAPGSPPLTGESTATMFFFAQALCDTARGRCARRRRIDEDLHAAAFGNPSRPSATASTTGGVGRLTKTISHADATAAGESRACAPRSTRGRMIVGTRVVNREIEAGIQQAARHAAAHPPYADKTNTFCSHVTRPFP